ncbi:MAG: hypothetical protein AB4372_23375 [Xenococcus sp. (in: cyanobacteria)]
MTNLSLDKTGSKFSLQLTLFFSSVIFFAIIAILWVLLHRFPSFEGGISAKDSALADMGNTIVVFSFIALALQSSLGIFVSNFRALKRNSKSRQIDNLKEDIAEIKALINPSPVSVSDESSSVEPTTSSSSPSQPVANVVILSPEQLAQKESELKILKPQLKEAELDLENYRNTTKNIIALLSLLAGIVISLAGVRILQPFADVSLVGIQLSLFNAIDVLLTGGLLAGGSAGVHRLTKVYEDVTDVSKKVNK